MSFSIVSFQFPSLSSVSQQGNFQFVCPEKCYLSNLGWSLIVKSLTLHYIIQQIEGCRLLGCLWVQCNTALCMEHVNTLKKQIDPLTFKMFFSPIISTSIIYIWPFFWFVFFTKQYQLMPNFAELKQLYVIFY